MDETQNTPPSSEGGTGSSIESKPQHSPKGAIAIIVVLAILAVGGYLLYQRGGDFDMGTEEEEAAPVEATLAPELELTREEKSGDVSEKKAEILVIVSSGRPLTAEERAEIGGIMLTKAHIYQFSEPERVKIFEALQR
ncbi:MAG: hypothetical protein Q7R88_02970 [bacterium]|nr:hypothetical protein [bacterium]